MNKQDRIYVIYDERAMYDIEEASVHVAGATSLNEARKDAQDFKPCVILSYAKEDKELKDETFEEFVT